jgi:hypothetical protein
VYYYPKAIISQVDLQTFGVVLVGPIME